MSQPKPPKNPPPEPKWNDEERPPASIPFFIR